MEQNLHFAAGVADRHYVVEGGRVVDRFHRDDMQTQADKIKAYLGV